MNFELDHDLTAWADGSLSREDLLTLHGNEAGALVTLHERLIGAAAMPAPDPVAGWELLRGKMDAKVVGIRTGARPGLRRAVLAVAAAVLIGGGAFAAIRGTVFDGPSTIAPPAASVAPRADTHGQATGAKDGRVSDGRSGGPTTSSGAAEGPGDGTAEPSGTGTTGATDGAGETGGTDGTAGSTSGDGTGGSDSGSTQDPGGQHPGKGNGGEDNGKDASHGHAGASSSTQG